MGSPSAFLPADPWVARAVAVIVGALYAFGLVGCHGSAGKGLGLDHGGDEDDRTSAKDEDSTAQEPG